MKVGLIVIASNENLYLRDFVEYYKTIGVDQIILGDNSPENGDYPQLVIGDYIKSGFVKYINYRNYNKDGWLIDFYNKTINEYKNEFDWIMVFDVDEYLTFNNQNIHTVKEFLSSNKIFNNVGQIKVNWRVYGDNDKLYYENIPVMKRFSKPAEPIDFLNVYCNPPYIENTTTKLIINCNMDIIKFITPHIAITIKDNNIIGGANPSGELINIQSGVSKLDYNIAQLNHYQTLTISEFLYRRLSRGGKKLMNGDLSQIDNMLKMFFACNKNTKEKEEIIKNFINLLN